MITFAYFCFLVRNGPHGVFGPCVTANFPLEPRPPWRVRSGAGFPSFGSRVSRFRARNLTRETRKPGSPGAGFPSFRGDETRKPGSPGAGFPSFGSRVSGFRVLISTRVNIFWRVNDAPKYILTRVDIYLAASLTRLNTISTPLEN